MESSVDRFKGRMMGTEERISKLEDRTVEMTQFEQQRENILRKFCTKPQGPTGLIMKEVIFISLASNGRRKKMVGLKKCLKE